MLILADGSLGQIDFGSVGRLHAAQQLALARRPLAVDRADPSYCEKRYWTSPSPPRQ